jgi:hypothetical protein
MHLGVLGLKVWQRPAPPVAHERHRHPMAAQARDRWRQGDQLACEVQQRGPDTRVVHVADRAGDRPEWLLEAARRAPGARAACIIRATGDRRISTTQEVRDVWEDMPQARAVGSITVELTRPPNRPPRQAPLSVAVTRVMCHGARRPGGRLPPVAVVAVSAKERRPPGGAEPRAWLFRTRLPVAEVPSAWTVGPW